MPIETLAIDHVQVATTPDREAACIAFYRDLLGLTQIPKPEALKARGGAWFRVGALQLHLGVDPTLVAGAKAHVCLLVRDLESARRSCAAAGLAVTDEAPTDDGLCRFFVRDPAGNRVEIAARG